MATTDDLRRPGMGAVAGQHGGRPGVAAARRPQAAARLAAECRQEVRAARRARPRHRPRAWAGRRRRAARALDRDPPPRVRAQPGQRRPGGRAARPARAQRHRPAGRLRAGAEDVRPVPAPVRDRPARAASEPGAVGLVGLAALPVIVVCIASAIVAAWWLGRVLGLPRRLAGLDRRRHEHLRRRAPSCRGRGAIEAEDDEVSYAVACVTLFGLLALFGYPFFAYWAFGGARISSPASSSGRRSTTPPRWPGPG